MLFMFVCELWCPTHIVLSFCFVFLRLVASISGLSIFIASLVFSNVYLLCAQCSVFFADPFTNIQDEYFVGASDIEEEGTWTWITNQSSSYMVFREGQPNNVDNDYKGLDADCAVLQITYKLLLDEYCLQTKPYMCEDNS
jgi:hypothetical protein